MVRRLAFFLPSLNGGGAERVMVNLAQGIADRGFEVDMVLAQATGPFLDQLKPNVRVVDLASRRVLTSVYPLLRYLRHERPVALVSALDHANAMAVVSAALARVPTRSVVTVHNTLSIAAANSTSLRGRLSPHWVRLSYGRADAIVAVSHGVARDLLKVTKVPRMRVHVIYNPVVSETLYERAKKPLEHPWFAPGEPPVVVSVGRLSAQKNYALLLRAFALVQREVRARLVILGEGEERSNLEGLAAELGVSTNVAFPGFVDNPYPFIQQAAVFVLSSSWEGLPTVLIEALALGKPVVSTNCPSGPEEILEGGRLGRLVPVGDEIALAQGIVGALRESSRSAADPSIARRFAIGPVTDAYLKVMLGPTTVGRGGSGAH